MFVISIAVISIFAGAIAAIAGFGIGSLLTPLFALQFDTQLAVAAISIPHAVGTTVRFFLLRDQIDRRLLLSFGITSAAGGLLGALLQTQLGNPALTLIFAILLIFAGLMGISGWSRRMQFRGVGAWLAGALSGFLGGLVGNQGGIRSAAMLGLDVPRDAFIATATAVALFVDAARVPVYLYSQGARMVDAWQWIAIAIVGVVLGTLGGQKILNHIPPNIFHRVVSLIILALGIFMLFRS